MTFNQAINCSRVENRKNKILDLTLERQLTAETVYLIVHKREGPRREGLRCVDSMILPSYHSIVEFDVVST
jgi:hypothetical protein